MSDGYNTLTELCAGMGRGKVLYQWTPDPIGVDPNHCDIPGEYAVIELPGRADKVMIVGTYRGQWHCNASARLLVSHLLSKGNALAADRDEYRKLWSEYADCLQHLCMSTLYDACRPVSHRWPGMKHVDSIREGVAELLRRNQEMLKALECADTRLATATHAHEIETRRIVRAALAAVKWEE